MASNRRLIVRAFPGEGDCDVAQTHERRLVSFTKHRNHRPEDASVEALRLDVSFLVQSVQCVVARDLQGPWMVLTTRVTTRAHERRDDAPE